MAHYKTKSTSRNTADILDDIVLDENPGDTRKVFRGMIVKKQTKKEATVRGFLIHQRKNRNDDWEDAEAINLAKLKGGDGVKLELRSHQTKNLYEALTHLYKIAEVGIPRGEKEWTVESADQVIKVDQKRKMLIKRLLEQNFGDEVWSELLDQNPDLATKLAHARLQQNRIQSLSLFEEALKKNDLNEDWWQNYFVNNPWIFGYGLNYQFLHLLDEQADYGGTRFTGKGAQKGDFLMNSGADIRFTVLVEIKKSNTPLFQLDGNKEYKRHRNGAILLHDELTGGILQLQSNCHRWETEGSKRQDDFEELTSKYIYTYQPKGILVIGHSSQLKNPEARSTFELCRRNTFNPEILTFDELYDRAKFIVHQHHEEKKDKSYISDAFDDFDDDLPF
jgi:hypothetical protein